MLCWCQHPSSYCIGRSAYVAFYYVFYFIKRKKKVCFSVLSGECYRETKPLHLNSLGSDLDHEQLAGVSNYCQSLCLKCQLNTSQSTFALNINISSHNTFTVNIKSLCWHLQHSPRLTLIWTWGLTPSGPRPKCQGPQNTDSIAWQLNIISAGLAWHLTYIWWRDYLAKRRATDN